MGAKISADTVFALELVRKGKSVPEAANEAGIYRSTLYRAIKRRKAAIEETVKAIKSRAGR